LTSVKDTLQTSRLSVNARVDATGTAAGSSTVKLKTVASAPANTISTANLRAGDSLVIGTGTYTILDIIDADEFTVSPVVASGDADDDDVIYLNMKPQHVVTLTTTTAVANGFIQVLLPADATTPNDGNPDDQGYDFNTSVAVVAADVMSITLSPGSRQPLALPVVPPQPTITVSRSTTQAPAVSAKLLPSRSAIPMAPIPLLPRQPVPPIPRPRPTPTQS
jgi:hypothetical protein